MSKISTKIKTMQDTMQNKVIETINGIVKEHKECLDKVARENIEEPNWKQCKEDSVREDCGDISDDEFSNY